MSETKEIREDEKESTCNHVGGGFSHTDHARHGCDRPGGPFSVGLRGNAYGGQLTTTFDVADIKSVDIEGRWQIELTQGDEWQVEASHSEDLEDDVNVYVRGDRLVLSRRSSGAWRWWRRSETRLKAEIVMPELTELELAGANQLDLSGFAGDRLKLEVAGAIGYYGTVSEERVRIAGIGRVRSLD